VTEEATMKLIGIMNLEKDKTAVRKLFEKHGVQIYSEMEITGHTVATIEKYGWRPTRDVPVYSSLCFAIIAGDRADEIMSDIARMSQVDDSGHPVRAFQVERMT
jgi:hypothetical protein